MTRKTSKRDRVGDRLIDRQSYERRIAPPDANGCRMWLGVTNNIGYGFINFAKIDGTKGGMMTAHRLALMLKLDREIAPGMNANHSCHNRLCCEPSHLSEGTQQQKMKQLSIDGRAGGNTSPRGPLNHKQLNRTYKYNEEEIQWIRNADLDAIMQRFNIVQRNRAAKLRWACRNSYSWLPWTKE